MTTRRKPAPFAVLKLPSRNTELVLYGYRVANALTDNVDFPDPTWPVATLVAHLAALHETLVTRTLASEREAARADVVHDLQHLRDYVQSVVETNTSPSDAAALIESVQMYVRRVGKRNKATLAATRHAAGTVLLVAKAVGRHALYYWQYSVDQVSWVSVPETRTADTMIEGLATMTTYYFRFAALTIDGRSDFSQPVSLLLT